MEYNIKSLNKSFPNLNAVPSEEFAPDFQEGIWFRQEGECHPDGRPYFDFYGELQVHPQLSRELAKMGMFAEPYDGGTWFAWKG